MGTPAGPSSRRRVLGRAAVVGLVGLAGCIGLAAPWDRGEGTGDAVDVLAAGSLLHTFEESLAEETAPHLRIEAHGSATVARLVAEGLRDPDIVTVADPALFEGPLEPPWYVIFAGNELVLAYNRDTPGGRRVERADRWFDPLLADDVALGRTDADLDPLGYRTVFALQLAERHHGRPGLAEAILAPEQRYPETALLSRLETGAIDTAVCYRNMAVERDHPFRELPPAVDLGDPDLADGWYDRVSYTLPDGTTVVGDAIRFAATLRTDDPVAREAFATLVAGSYREAAGLTVEPPYPEAVGDVPETVRDAIEG
ncbi:MAG: extracellular solute-binding protein [Halobacteriales archaeon]